MKIGIITHPMRFNYGGILQAYALQTILERMGHQVWVIRKSEVKDIPINPIIYTKRILKNVIKSILNLLGCSYKKELILQEYIFNKSFPFITSKIWPFVEKHIHSLMVEEKFVAPSTFDCLVVGSDQIWRPKLIAAEKGKIEHCFLDFAEDWKIKRIAYAASLGVDYWEFSPKQTEICSRLIKKFDAVSVREKSSIKLCKDNFGTEPEWMMDPTMLLQTSDYKKIINEDNIHNNLNGCLLYYILDPTEQKNKLVSDLACQKALSVHKMEGEIHDLLQPTQPLPSIGTWLNSIMTSDFVITDSFHGTVFSIIFNRPFFVMTNNGRGNARIESLLNMFELEDRLLTDTVSRLKIQDINWSHVNKIMAEWKEKSNLFLINALIK